MDFKTPHKALTRAHANKFVRLLEIPEGGKIKSDRLFLIGRFVADYRQNEHNDRLPLETLICFKKKIVPIGPKLRLLEMFKYFAKK